MVRAVTPAIGDRKSLMIESSSGVPNTASWKNSKARGFQEKEWRTENVVAINRTRGRWCYKAKVLFQFYSRNLHAFRGNLATLMLVTIFDIGDMSPVVTHHHTNSVINITELAPWLSPTLLLYFRMNVSLSILNQTLIPAVEWFCAVLIICAIVANTEKSRDLQNWVKNRAPSLTYMIYGLSLDKTAGEFTGQNHRLSQNWKFRMRWKANRPTEWDEIHFKVFRIFIGLETWTAFNQMTFWS